MTVDEINPEVVEQLKASEKLRGPIEKVVLSADGKTLVDGHQRKAADPDWPEEVNEKLKTEEDCILFDIDKNWNRTSKSEAWKHSRIERLARLGNSVQDIMRKTGFKEWKVYQYYPDDLKDQAKAAAGRVGGPAASVVRVTTQIEEEELRKAEEKARAIKEECANCHMGYRLEELKYIGEKPYCPRCVANAHIAYEKEQRRLKKSAEVAKEPASIASFDGPEQKAARMSPQKSAFEERVVFRFNKWLEEQGLHSDTKREFCVLSTKPDDYVEEIDGLVYVDGPPHLKSKQADKDERLRDLLKKHHDELNIKPFPFKADTQQEEDRVFKEMCLWAEGLKAEMAKWPEIGAEEEKSEVT